MNRLHSEYISSMLRQSSNFPSNCIHFPIVDKFVLFVRTVRNNCYRLSGFNFTFIQLLIIIVVIFHTLYILYLCFDCCISSLLIVRSSRYEYFVISTIRFQRFSTKEESSKSIGENFYFNPWKLEEIYSRIYRRLLKFILTKENSRKSSSRVFHYKERKRCHCSETIAQPMKK